MHAFTTTKGKIWRPSGKYKKITWRNPWRGLNILAKQMDKHTDLTSESPAVRLKYYAGCNNVIIDHNNMLDEYRRIPSLRLCLEGGTDEETWTVLSNFMRQPSPPPGVPFPHLCGRDGYFVRTETLKARAEAQALGFIKAKKEMKKAREDAERIRKIDEREAKKVKKAARKAEKGTVRSQRADRFVSRLLREV